MQRLPVLLLLLLEVVLSLLLLVEVSTCPTLADPKESVPDSR